MRCGAYNCPCPEYKHEGRSLGTTYELCSTCTHSKNIHQKASRGTALSSAALVLVVTVALWLLIPALQAVGS